MYNIKTENETLSTSLAMHIFTEHIVSGRKINERLLRTAILECLSKDATLLKYISSPTEEMCETAVDADGRVISLIDNPSKDLCRKAVLNDYRAFKYIHNPDRDLCMLAISKDRYNFSYIHVPDWQMCQELLKTPAIQLKSEEDVTLQDWAILTSKINYDRCYATATNYLTVEQSYSVLFRVPMIRDNLIEFGNRVIDLVPTHYTYLIETISSYSEQNGNDSEYYRVYQSLLKDDVWLSRKNTNLGLVSKATTRASDDSNLSTIFGYDENKTSISMVAPKESTFKFCYTAIKTKVKDVYDRVRSVKDYTKVN